MGHTADRYINCHNEADEIMLKTANQPKLMVRGKERLLGNKTYGKYKFHKHSVTKHFTDIT
jgi:hypothetical protein